MLPSSGLFMVDSLPWIHFLAHFFALSILLISLNQLWHHAIHLHKNILWLVLINQYWTGLSSASFIKTQLYDILSRVMLSAVMFCIILSFVMLIVTFFLQLWQVSLICSVTLCWTSLYLMSFCRMSLHRLVDRDMTGV